MFSFFEPTYPVRRQRPNPYGYNYDDYLRERIRQQEMSDLEKRRRKAYEIQKERALRQQHAREQEERRRRLLQQYYNEHYQTQDEDEQDSEDLGDSGSPAYYRKQAHSAPNYQKPKYEEPRYKQPQYEETQYEQPQYNEPQYETNSGQYQPEEQTELQEEEPDTTENMSPNDKSSDSQQQKENKFTEDQAALILQKWWRARVVRSIGLIEKLKKIKQVSNKVGELESYYTSLIQKKEQEQTYDNPYWKEGERAPKEVLSFEEDLLKQMIQLDSITGAGRSELIRDTRKACVNHINSLLKDVDYKKKQHNCKQIKF